MGGRECESALALGAWANEHGPLFGPRAAPKSRGPSAPGARNRNCQGRHLNRSAPSGTAHLVGTGMDPRAFHIAPVMRAGIQPGQDGPAPAAQVGHLAHNPALRDLPAKAPLRGMGVIQTGIAGNREAGRRASGPWPPSSTGAGQGRPWEPGAALAPACKPRDLRHGLAARPLPDAASAVTGGPRGTRSGLDVRSSADHQAYLSSSMSAGWVRACTSWSWRMLTWV